jgi:beta-mannanase
MVDQMRAFAAFRGRPIDIANVKSNGTKDAQQLESSILAKGPVYQALHDADIAVSQVLDFIPADPGGDGYAMALGGAFDALWTRIGQALAGYPKRRTFYVRLGHELNGTFAWGPQRDARKYVAAFRRCALILKATVPGVQIDWNWLRRPNGVAYEAAYPGDDVVDVVGMDPYGNQDGLDTPAGVAQYLSATEGASPAGPASALAWAKARGKKVGWAEWGVTVEPGVGDRDYPLYIEAMFDFLKANAEFVAYDIYFEIDASGEGRGRNHLLGPGTDAPRASQRYAELWRAG